MTTKSKVSPAPSATLTELPLPPRTPTKAQRLVELLKSPEGASIEELGSTLGWQPHTVRAALTGLRKKGHAIVRGQQGSVTVYSIEA